jgi:hypothetical protein
MISVNIGNYKHSCWLVAAQTAALSTSPPIPTEAWQAAEFGA